MMRAHLVISILTFLFLTSCDNSQKNLNISKYNYQLSLQEEIPLEGALLSGANRVVEISNSYYVLDSQRRKIFQFSHEGVLLNSFGSRGKGPGEFQYPVSLSTDSDELIYTYDRNLQRVNVFDTSGSFVRAINLDSNGQQMIVANNHIYLYNPAIWDNNRPMVKVFEKESGDQVEAISPASDLIANFKIGITGASIMGLATSGDTLAILQHPMHLKVRLYNTRTNTKINEFNIGSEYFTTPEFTEDYSPPDSRPSDVTNAVVSGFYSHNNRIFIVYMEYGTSTKYMDVINMEGDLLNEEPVLLDEKWPRYMDAEGYFYSFAYVDSTHESAENATVALRRYEVTEELVEISE